MATLSWTYWFLFDGMSAAGRVNVPALFVHSDGCVFPDNLRAVHERVRGPKRLVWSEGTQTDFYDQPAQARRVHRRRRHFSQGWVVMTLPAATDTFTRKR